MRTLKRNVGFTLIELLVVISIIALLVSILLPALKNAREGARRVVCSSNLHQLGIGFYSYTSDFNDALPPYSYATDLTDYYRAPWWHETVMPYLGHSSKLTNFGYVGDDESKIFIHCPSRRPGDGRGTQQSYAVSYPTIFAFAMEEGFPTVLPEYIFNGSAKLSNIPSNVWMVSDSNTPYTRLEASHINNPVAPNFYFVVDYDGDGINDSLSLTDPYNGVNPLHNGSANMLFADASVKPIAIIDWVQNKGGMWGTQSPNESEYK